MAFRRPHATAALSVTWLLACILSSNAQNFVVDSCIATGPAYQAVSGRFGTVNVKANSNCTYQITTTATMSTLVLTASGLDSGDAEAWVCDGPICDGLLVLDLSEGAITQLPAADYPNGVWLTVHVPGGAELPPWAAIQFSSWTDNCTFTSRTPLLFFHTPFDSGLEPGPSYSLCVMKPDISGGRTTFSWGWSLETLPTNLVDGGFYAQLTPFPVAIRTGVYRVRFTLPTPVDTLPISGRLLLKDSTGVTIAEFTENVRAYFLPPGTSVTRAVIEFYVPPGTPDLQNVTVEILRSTATSPPPRSGPLPSPPPPPHADTCRPASEPLLAQTGALPTYSIEMPIAAFTQVPNGWDVDATTLVGGCAFSFPPITAAGDRVKRHSLFFASAQSPYTAALAWLSGSPLVGQVLLAPGTAASLPAELNDNMTVLLSGDGRIAPLWVEYLAELSACAEAGSVPVHLTPIKPHLREDVTMSLCTPAPIFTDVGAQALLDLSFGWGADTLPSVFSDSAGFEVNLHDYDLGAGQRLNPGWYRATFQQDPAVVLQLKLGNTPVTRNITFYLPTPVDSISVSATMPSSAGQQAVSIGIKLSAVVFPPPQPPSPPPQQPEPMIPLAPPPVAPQPPNTPPSPPPSTPPAYPPPFLPNEPSVPPSHPSPPLSPPKPVTPNMPNPPSSPSPPLSPDVPSPPPPPSPPLVPDAPNPPPSPSPPLSPNTPNPPSPPSPPLSPNTPNPPPSPSLPLSPDAPNPPPPSAPPLSPDAPNPPPPPSPPLSPDAPNPPSPPPPSLSPETPNSVSSPPPSLSPETPNAPSSPSPALSPDAPNPPTSPSPDGPPIITDMPNAPVLQEPEAPRPPALPAPTAPGTSPPAPTSPIPGYGGPPAMPNMSPANVPAAHLVPSYGWSPSMPLAPSYVGETAEPHVPPASPSIRIAATRSPPPKRISEPHAAVSDGVSSPPPPSPSQLGNPLSPPSAVNPLDSAAAPPPPSGGATRPSDVSIALQLLVSVIVGFLSLHYMMSVC